MCCYSSSPPISIEGGGRRLVSEKWTGIRLSFTTEAYHSPPYTCGIGESTTSPLAAAGGGVYLVEEEEGEGEGPPSSQAELVLRRERKERRRRRRKREAAAVSSSVLINSFPPSFFSLWAAEAKQAGEREKKEKAGKCFAPSAQFLPLLLNFFLF